MGYLVEFMSWFVCFFPDSGGSGSGASAGSFDGGSEDRCVKFDFLLGPLCNFTLLEFVCCGVCCIFYLLQGVFCKSQDELNIWDPAPSKKTKTRARGGDIGRCIERAGGAGGGEH